MKQGCVMSPTLFNSFINDLPEHFNDECHPVSLHVKKISCLLYAGDLILLSETEKGLQNYLNTLSVYCKDWKLNVNISKTMVIIFNKSGNKLARKFNCNVES